LSIGSESGRSGLEIALAVPVGPGVGPALRIVAAHWLAVIAIGSPRISNVVALDVGVVIESPSPLGAWGARRRRVISSTGLAESDIETGRYRALVQPSVIVIREAVGGRAVASNQVDVLRPNNRSCVALWRRDRWSGATHVHAWTDSFRSSKSIRWWIVPLFARRQASHDLAISPHSQISQPVVFILRTCVDVQVAVRGHARS
jgi:hypothetical protein